MTGKFYMILMADDYMTDGEKLRRLGGIAKALGGGLYEGAPTYRKKTTEATYYYSFPSASSALAFKGYVKDLVTQFRGVSKGPMSQEEFDSYLKTP